MYAIFSEAERFREGDAQFLRSGCTSRWEHPSQIIAFGVTGAMSRRRRWPTKQILPQLWNRLLRAARWTDRAFGWLMLQFKQPQLALLRPGVWL